MNLWIYGDSFSVPNNKDSGVEKTWLEIVSNNLNLRVQNFSEMGISNDFIYHEIIRTNKEWCENDLVIVQLTAPWREWFFEDFPHLSNFSNCSWHKDLEDAQVAAVEEYSKYLVNDRKHLVQYHMIQTALKHFARNNIKMLVLPGFHHVEEIPGTLSTICFNEFDSQDTANKFYKYHKLDPRINHLSKENHKILGNRITNFFLKGELPNLIDGYEQNIISIDTYKEINNEY